MWYSTARMRSGATAIGIRLNITIDDNVKRNNSEIVIGTSDGPHHAQIMASIVALKSIKPDYRQAAKVIFHPMSYYIDLALAKSPENADGWYMKSIINPEHINRLRTIFSEYRDIEVCKQSKRKREQRECRKLAWICLKEKMPDGKI